MTGHTVSRRRWHAAVAPALVLLGFFGLDPAPATADDLVTEARMRYNDGQFDDAIALAAEAWRESESPGAAVVLARSRLERFRVWGDPDDLDVAHGLLRTIDLRELSTAERHEWELGVATSLYWQGDYGPAAEVLDQLLRASSPEGPDRERLVDWWASAVDQMGHRLGKEERRRIYDRLVRRLESELVQYPDSPSAAYWLVEAVRGAGDTERAWSLGAATWIRAGQGNAALRIDLDRLMLQGIIPDLAVSRIGLPPEDPETIAVMAQLAIDWEAVKARWASR